MTKKLDPQAFASAVQQVEVSERDAHLAQFSQQHGMSLTPEEWLEIAQMFCELYTASEPEFVAVCAIVNPPAQE